MSEPEKKKHHYFDVDRFRHVFAQTSRPMGRWGKMFRKLTLIIDTMQGLFITIIVAGLGLSFIAVVVAGAFFGAWASLIVVIAMFGGLGYFAEKKVGKSLQFGDYSMLRKTIASTIAFGLVMGLLFLIIYLSRLGTSFGLALGH
jgi:hypothetical protein